MPRPEDRQADFPARVYIGIEPRPPSICGFGLDLGRFAGVLGTEIDGEFEEAVFVG